MLTASVMTITNNAIPEHLKDDPVLCEACSPRLCTELITADTFESLVDGCRCYSIRLNSMSANWKTEIRPFTHYIHCRYSRTSGPQHDGI